MDLMTMGALGALLLGVTDTLELPPDRDNTLVESPTGSLSNGQGGSVFCGRTGQTANSVRRALLHFDLTALPPDAVVESVALRLQLTGGTSSIQDCSLFALDTGWGEGTSNAGPTSGGMGAPATPGDATWLHTFYDTSFWTTPGGDFALAPSATLAVGDVGEALWSSTPELVLDVQGWIDDPASNHGWLVQGNEGSGGTSKRFASRESDDVGARPVLIVEYSTPAGVPALGPKGAVLCGILLGLGITLASRRAQRATSA